MRGRRNIEEPLVYAFGPFTMDQASGELLRGGKAVGLPVQSSKILKLLLENAGQLLSREDICKTVWSDRFVDFDAGLNSEIKKIRRALDDDPASPKYIETIPRRGYRFIGEVLVSKKTRANWIGKFAVVAASTILLGFVAAMYFQTVPGDDIISSARAPENDSAAQLQSPAYAAHLKGVVALQSGDVDLAAEMFSTAIDLDPEYAPAYIGAARVNVRRRNEGWFRIEAARRFAEKAIEIQPGNVDAATIKAGLLLYYYRDNATSAAILDALLTGGADSAEL